MFCISDLNFAPTHAVLSLYPPLISPTVEDARCPQQVDVQIHRWWNHHGPFVNSERRVGGRGAERSVRRLGRARGAGAELADDLGGLKGTWWYLVRYKYVSCMSISECL